MSIDRLTSVGTQGLGASPKRTATETEAGLSRQVAPAAGDSSTFAASVAETDNSSPVQTVQGAPKVQATVLTRLRIEFSEDAHRFVYQSVEPITGNVVGQFPKEEVIRRLAFLREQHEAKYDTKA